MSVRLTGDRKARETARSTFDKPIVLRAGAGTGKTASLVARVVTWLVDHGWSQAALSSGEAENHRRTATKVLKGVVAITFTEAAAAEMAERISEALYSLSTDCAVVGLNPDALPPEARTRASVLLPLVDQLEVRTIHAWCRSLLAEFPLEAGLHPLFSVDASGELTARIIREQVEAHLSAMMADERLPTVLGLFQRGVSPTDIESGVASLIDADIDLDHLRAERFQSLDLNGLWLRLRDGITDVIDCIDSRLEGVRAPNGIELLSGLLRFRACLEPDASLADIQSAQHDILPDRLVSHLLKAWANGKSGKGESAALSDVSSRLSGLAESVHSALVCIGGLDAEGYRLSQSVLGPIVSSVQAEMRSRGVLGFTALLVRAARLLRNQSVARRARARIDQLLVDEFQDTDPLQCDIVRALALQGDRATRPGLFLVGDPKQSIYGWRSADLRAYEGFVQEVLAEGGEEHSLVLNFRSTRCILDEVDRCMAGLLVPRAGIQPGPEPLIAARGDGPLSSRVEAWVSWEWLDQQPVIPTGADAARLIEARALAEDIKSRHADGVSLADIGVLFRSTTQLQVYQWALRDAGIPYEVTRDRNYFRRREVVECAAMMRAVLDPMDTLALVTFLRSSMVNMPDSALLPLWRAGFPGAWAQLSEPTLEHCIDAIRTAETDCRRLHPHVEGLEAVASWADHLEAVVRRVAVLRDEIQTTPFDLWLDRVRELLLPDVVNSLAYQGVYRLANIERFFRLLAEKVSDSAGGFHGVLRHLRDAVAHQREAEESRPTDAGDAVQLMTVHKSKGLAFTHTYVVDLHHRFKAFSIRGGTYASVKHGIQLLGMWTPNFDLEWSHRREVERAERVRLLYVAMTRARDRLVLMGSWPRILSGQRGAKQGLDLFGDRVPPLPGPTEVWPTIPDGMDSAQKDHIHWRFPGRYPAEVNVAEQAEAGLAVQAARPTSEAQRLWSIKRADRPWTQGPSSVAEESESGPPKSVLGRAEALKIGTVIHGLLEQIAKGEVEVNPESFAALADSLIGDGPVSPAGQERIAVLLETLREGSLLRYLSSIDIIGTEVPFIMQETGQGPVGAWVGSIDLMYRCPDTGDIVIVDHKTDRVGDRSIDDVAAHHAGQGSLYAQAVMQALGLSTPPRFEVWLIEADARVEVG